MDQKHPEEKEKRKILVLEDDIQIAKAIREALSAQDFDVYMVNNVADGLTQLESIHGIEAIWLDHYLLGTGSGLDFVIQTKTHDEWKNIPIFVVSNSASALNVHSYIQLGVHQYYTKADYDLGQIIRDIKYALEHPSMPES